MNELTIHNLPHLPYELNEAFNTLCTNLSFAGPDMKVVMITSYRAGEGKSYVAMNLLRSLAGLGKRVVLVDADLRRSTLKEDYGFSFHSPRESKGVTHFLAHLCTLEEAVYETNICGADIMPVTRTVKNSLSLLNTSNPAQLLRHLSGAYDLVLVDAPPVGVIIDAAEIAKHCDGTLFVVNHNRATRKELAECRDLIERTGCAVLGAVLNNVSFESHGTKRYQKSYYYRGRKS